MSGPRRILIVEDEPLIAMMLEDILATLDREVAGVLDSVPAALARIAEGGIDAAILDVHLRGHTCWPVADALAERGIPFVIASGGGERVPDPHGARPVLAKPFTVDGVRSRLDALA
ncbi:response regulator [Sphingomonas canadensis]|uniref:Response regulator n=1 Tax=Sphingomonas canadensis TaxID=1219257 RepID=A0ABW3HBX6_9SPHN|nr:response regulator [Sphingomonas canadensis]MCW3836893.1 response regulator [Sphingomonas canadensis]